LTDEELASPCGAVESVLEQKERKTESPEAKQVQFKLGASRAKYPALWWLEAWSASTADPEFAAGKGRT
jgi:hypothetical protein